MATFKDDGLESMMGKLGDFGRYQCFQFVLQVIGAIPTGMAMIALVTIAAVPDHRCAIDGIDNETYVEHWNSTHVIDNIPTNDYGKVDTCTIYGFNNTIEECTSWVYDNRYIKSSRGIEWDFVCSRRWMGASAQAVFMIGVVIGSIVLGPLCDTFGRRKVYLWTATLQFISGIAVAFTTEYYAFLVLRLLFGIFAVSPFKAGYILMIELVGQSKRAFCGALFQILYGVGIMLLGLWGYLIENRFYLQIVYALHAVVMLPHWFLIDESPRWLWAKGRVREAIAIVDKALKMNDSKEKLDIPLITSHYKALFNPLDQRSTGVIDLFRTPNMAKRTFILCGCWLAVSVVYYGLTLNTGKLSGNPYLLLFISGFVELPGYILGMYFANKVGHRAVLSSSLLMSGVACLITVFLPIASTPTTVAAMVGKLIGSASYAIIYKYSTELFPTVIRSSGVSLGSMCASLSAALTPLITLLDAFRPEIPTLVFGVLALIFGLLCLLLPETRGRRLPQTLADGERFGEGENCFSTCRSRSSSVSDSDIPEIEPLKLSDKV